MPKDYNEGKLSPMVWWMGENGDRVVCDNCATKGGFIAVDPFTGEEVMDVFFTEEHGFDSDGDAVRMARQKNVYGMEEFTGEYFGLGESPYASWSADCECCGEMVWFESTIWDKAHCSWCGNDTPETHLRKGLCFNCEEDAEILSADLMFDTLDTEGILKYRNYYYCDETDECDRYLSRISSRCLDYIAEFFKNNHVS